MKHLIKASLWVLSATLLFSCSKQEQGQTAKDSSTATTSAPTAAKGRYGIKSGIFTVKSNAMGQNITTTTYFDDYGKKEYQEAKMEIEVMPGQTMKTNNVTLVNGDGFRYNIDMEKKTGIKMKDIGGSASATDMSAMSEKMSKEYHIKKEAPVTILGKTCDSYSMDGKMGKGTFATWQGISMRSEMTVSGMKTPMKIEATKLEENVSIPSDKFEVPKDVTITSR